MLRLRRPINEALAAVAAGPKADIAYGRTPRSAQEVVDGLGLNEAQRLALIPRVQEWVTHADHKLTRKLAIEGALSMFPDRPRQRELVRRVIILGESEWQKAELVWVLEKSSGPFIGPRGGKWADAQHTIPWHEGHGDYKRVERDISRLEFEGANLYSGKRGKKEELQRYRSARRLVEATAVKYGIPSEALEAHWAGENRERFVVDWRKVPDDHPAKAAWNRDVRAHHEKMARESEERKVIEERERPERERRQREDVIRRLRAPQRKALFAAMDREGIPHEYAYAVHEFGHIARDQSGGSWPKAYMRAALRASERLKAGLVLEKGAGHKYMVRVPRKNPPPRWRYVYKMPTRKHLVADEHLREGVKVKVEHKGKVGHVEIKGHDEKTGIVRATHDETGEDINVHVKDLRQWSKRGQGQSREEAAKEPKAKVKKPAKQEDKKPDEIKEQEKKTEEKPAKKQTLEKPKKVQTIAPEAIGDFQEIVGFLPTAEAVDKAEAGNHELAAIPQDGGFLVVRRPKAVKSKDGSLTGEKTKVFLRGASGQGFGELDAEYVAVEAETLVASHKPGGTFSAHEKYPEDVQERRYEDLPGEQLKVQRIAKNLEPELLVNTNPDGVNGTPVVTGDNVVLGGNGRTMGMQLAYQDHPESADKLRAHLISHAHTFGLQAEALRGMKNPVLVRKVKTGGETKDLRKLGRRLNQALTQGMDPRTAEVAAGKNFVTPQLLSHLVTGMDSDESLADFLHSSKSRDFVLGMRRSGIIDDLNADQYLDKATGLLNEDGRLMAERVIVARVLPDARILSAMQQQTRTSLAKSMPYVLRAEEAGWDLREPLMAAVKADIAYRRDFKGSRGSFLRQKTTGNDPTDPLGALQADPMAAALFHALDRGSRAMPQGFRSFARRAEQAAHDRQGFAMLAGEPENPVRAMDRAFGVSVEAKKENAEENRKAQEAQDQLLRGAGLEPKEQKKRGPKPKAEPEQAGMFKGGYWGLLHKAWGVKDDHLNHYLLDGAVRELQWMARQGVPPKKMKRQLAEWMAYEIEHDPEMARAVGSGPLSTDAINGLIEAVTKQLGTGKPKKLRKSMAPRLLLKSQQPGGGGWQPIPRGRQGGFRRRKGTRWEYWYPGDKAPRGAPHEDEPKHVHKAAEEKPAEVAPEPKVGIELSEALSKEYPGKAKQKTRDLDKLYDEAREANGVLEEQLLKIATTTNGKPVFAPSVLAKFRDERGFEAAKRLASKAPGDVKVEIDENEKKIVVFDPKFAKEISSELQRQKLDHENSEGIKGKTRVTEKLQKLVDESGKPDPRKLTDLVRGSISFDSIEGVYKALEEISKSPTIKIKRFNDRFRNPTDMGYRDIIINVEFPNGHIGELQLHINGILELKNGEAHKLYEQSRTIEERIVVEKRSPTDDEAAEVFKLANRQFELYEGAYRKALRQ